MKTAAKTTGSAAKKTTATVKKTTTTKKPTPTITTLAKGERLVRSGEFSAKLLALINAERTKAGLAALTYRSDLQAVADLRAKELVDRFGSTRPNGTAFDTALTAVGVSFTTPLENIEHGCRDAAALFDEWNRLPACRDRLLNGVVTDTVIGVCQCDDGTLYWVQLYFDKGV